MTPPFAHAGHWLADLLYVAPLAVALGFLFFQSRRDKRRDAEEAVSAADPPPTS
jgi:uncharacterized membrane protein SirB2